MAKLINNKTELFGFALALFVIFTIAESRAVGLVKAEAAPVCASVLGVISGDTCFSIAQSFGLSTADFNAINPNLNCAGLFVGQWLCVAGSS